MLFTGGFHWLRFILRNPQHVIGTKPARQSRTTDMQLNLFPQMVCICFCMFSHTQAHHWHLKIKTSELKMKLFSLCSKVNLTISWPYWPPPKETTLQQSSTTAGALLSNSHFLLPPPTYRKLFPRPLRGQNVFEGLAEIYYIYRIIIFCSHYRRQVRN